MNMLAEDVDFVIGVDTHRDTHSGAIVDMTGGVRHELTVTADQAGYEEIVQVARERAPGRRLFAVEGSGGYGAGLTRHLLAAGERVVEIDRPARPARRNGAKSDALDAVRAAREALSRAHLASPRVGGAREALRVLLATRAGAVAARTRAINQLRALVVSAPERLRAQLRGLRAERLVARCLELALCGDEGIEDEATLIACRSVASRIRALDTECRDLTARIGRLTQQMAPAMCREQGVGPVSAGRILLAWSHPGRLRGEAAFASLAGVAPIPASSGQVTRHRLNRGGDRQLNRALHTIVLCRLRIGHPESVDYARRRTLEGRSSREITRCLKRYLARRLFRLLEAEARGQGADAPALTELPGAIATSPAGPAATPPPSTTHGLRPAAVILARLRVSQAPSDALIAETP